ncbi:MAG: phenylalanine--tRNA ligase subunit beta [Dehalococcoidales bacterium]
MKVSLKWLQEYVDIDISPHELARRLTMAGTEVEGIHLLGENWGDAVIGEITAINPHPNADRLRLVTVDTGDNQTTVVCGAPNISTGIKIAFAPVGTQLIDSQSGKSFCLKSARIRGVSSSGMICSERELGISENHEGIMILPDESPKGKALADYLGDAVFDLAVTPNRPDCLSVIGIAREAAALTGKKIHQPDNSCDKTENPIEERLSVVIDAPALCPRYCASLITGVKIGSSPWWLQQRLIKCGMRPINNIVDITNYVMLEHGQPLHAFDYAQIRGGEIIVRRACKGESITTLDGIERTLSAETLVIADRERAVAIAGIMGGLDSEVTDDTTSILLEAANFNPASIHHTGSKLNLPSEACMRFERGIRPELVTGAIEKATKMIVDLGGGRALRGVIDSYPGAEEKKPILLTTGQMAGLLGIDFSIEKIISALSVLGFECRVESIPPGVRATAPYWRSDIKLPVDLIEEVIRITGYEEIPSTLLSTRLPSHTPEPMADLRRDIRRQLVGYGFQEIVTYSLTSIDRLNKLMPGKKMEPPMRMANPMTAEQEYLRPMLRSNLLATLCSNRRHEDDGIKIFELGKVYQPAHDKLPEEPAQLCGLMSGLRQEKSWHGDNSTVDFYDAKGVVEGLLHRRVKELHFEKGGDASLHPSRQATIVVDGHKIGIVGELHPMVQEAFDISECTVLFEINLTAVLPSITKQITFQPVPRFPAVIRDIALIVDTSTTHQSIYSIIRKFKSVTEVAVFDRYAGNQVPGGKISLAYRITFQSPAHTLTDDEVDKILQNILERLSRELGATLRS